METLILDMSIPYCGVILHCTLTPAGCVCSCSLPRSVFVGGSEGFCCCHAVDLAASEENVHNWWKVTWPGPHCSPANIASIDSIRFFLQTRRDTDCETGRVNYARPRSSRRGHKVQAKAGIQSPLWSLIPQSKRDKDRLCSTPVHTFISTTLYIGSPDSCFLP